MSVKINIVYEVLLVFSLFNIGQPQQERGAAQQQAGTSTGDEYKETGSREGRTRKEQMTHQQCLDEDQGIDADESSGY